MTASLARTSCFIRSIWVKGADTEVVSIEGTYTKSFCTKAASIGSIRGASIRGNSVKGTDWDILLMWSSLSDSKDTYIGNVSIGDTCGQGTYIGNTSTKGAGASVGAIKYSGMDS